MMALGWVNIKKVDTMDQLGMCCQTKCSQNADIGKKGGLGVCPLPLARIGLTPTP